MPATKTVSSVDSETVVFETNHPRTRKADTGKQASPQNALHGTVRRNQLEAGRAVL